MFHLVFVKAQLENPNLEHDEKEIILKINFLFHMFLYVDFPSSSS